MKQAHVRNARQKQDRRFGALKDGSRKVSPEDRGIRMRIRFSRMSGSEVSAVNRQAQQDPRSREAGSRIQKGSRCAQDRARQGVTRTD